MTLVIKNRLMKIFDSHLHIIDPKFPLRANNGYLPPTFTVPDYQTQTKGYPFVGGAVVSGSFQGFDQGYLVDALGQLGENYVGVTQVPHSISDDELATLQRAGVRAVRFNIKRGGSESVGQLENMAMRIYRLFGWHVELYIDSRDLPELTPLLLGLPKFSVDHLGLSREGLPHLYTLVEKGCRVKATGFGRIDFDPMEAMKHIHSINPQALLFGTDLPSTRARVPFRFSDMELVIQHFNSADAERILYTNAREWYLNAQKL